MKKIFRIHNTLSLEMILKNKCLLSLTVLPTIDLSTMPQKTIHVPAGRPVELVIPIAGRPPPAASWFFAGSKLRESERVTVETHTKVAKLTIRETTIKDTGEYTLELKNATGTTSETIKVIILGKDVGQRHTQVADVQAPSFDLK